MAGSTERQILTSPDVVARAAAAMAPDREQRWMLRQPRAIRRSYADEVLGQPDEDRHAEAWMLQQPREIRESYLREVVMKDPDAPRDMVWMLQQDDETCRSFARFVLLGEDVLGY
jgi:hypothetical protein